MYCKAITANGLENICYNYIFEVVSACSVEQHGWHEGGAEAGEKNGAERQGPPQGATATSAHSQGDQ